MEILSPSLYLLFSLLLFSAFAKIFTALSIMSVGIGIRGLGFGAVVAAVALMLSAIVMQPYLGEDNFFSDAAQKNSAVQIDRVHAKLKPFMEAHADREIQASFQKIQSGIKRDETSATESSSKDISVLGGAFLVTQLRDAFFLGLIFLIPFIVVDLIVANALMLLGMTQLPAIVIALPLKLFIFVAVDGWALISERLLNTFTTVVGG